MSGNPAFFTGEWDTAMNKSTQDVMKAQDTSTAASQGETAPLEKELSRLYTLAVRAGRDFSVTTSHANYRDAYAAFSNKHVHNSKYLTDRWKARSKLVRPKTRSGVRRRMVAAAGSLFNSRDVTNVTAENSSNTIQDASAKLNHAIINYRLDRPIEQGGLSWFLTCMGAVQDGNLTGLIVSKQYWDYSFKEIPAPTDPATGQPQIDAKTQQPMASTYKKVRSQPCVTLYPIENVIRDPGADWKNQSQSGQFLILRNPVSVSDMINKIKTERVQATGALRWVQLADSAVTQAAETSYESQAIRQAREASAGGQDPMKASGAGREFSMCWLDEVFLTYEGQQYVYWMLGQTMVGLPEPIEKAYPHAKGLRPVTIGLTEIEAHRTNPMSPASSWMPLQFESNDLTNLALDGLKATLNPLAKVKKGKGISLSQVQNRSADSVVYVGDEADITFDRPGDISGVVFEQMSRLDADFDDLAGQFNAGTVQTNRKLNDTVGGMKLMNNSASAATDFDLTVIIKTWVEPVLHQILLLEQFYEDDPNILQIAGETAELKKLNISVIDDHLIEQPLSLRVDVGMGSANPQQRLGNFAAAWETTTRILGEEVVIHEVKRDVVVDEIFSMAGYTNGSRFFNPQLSEDSRLTDMSNQIQQLNQAMQDKQKEFDNKLEAIRLTIAGNLSVALLGSAGKAAQSAQNQEHAVQAKVIDSVLRPKEPSNARAN